MLQRILILCAVLWTVKAIDIEESSEKYLEDTNELYAEWNNKMAIAEWNYASNITNETLAHKLAVSNEFAKFIKAKWLETVKYPWRDFKDPDLKRQFKKFSVLGTPALPEDKYEKYEKTVANMESIYSKAKICAVDNATKCDLSLEPELMEIMANSRNETELKHVWTEWRNVAGKPVRKVYTQYVSLINEAAKLNNFTNAAEYWLDSYDTPNMPDEIGKLWLQLRPFYLEIHSYIRRKLREKYGEEIVSKKGPIPAHLLGNMWAQSWSNIADLGLPYPNAKPENITKRLIEQHYTPLKMFKVAEEFFTSIGLDPMPDSFWNNSIIEKPKNRDLVCHASAWDFYDDADVRIKQCTTVTHEDFMTVHHEMGHIQYYLQYKDQPFVYREGANPGFHEAIGDLIALSVNTPKHYNRIGLLPSDVQYSEETNLNHLFQVALDKVVFLPFAYLMDLWRWNVFNGTTFEGDYNCAWWKYRLAIQGVRPPDERSEKDFDPAAKYHIVSSTPYIRYFVSFVLQFQFHEALCIKAGEYDPENEVEKPLHQCDIYKSTEAGNLLKEVLKLGSSKPWPDALEMMTGQRNMNASSILNYFAPVYEWLKKENRKSGEFIGWETNDRICRPRFSFGRLFRSVARKIKGIFTKSTS